MNHQKLVEDHIRKELPELMGVGLPDNILKDKTGEHNIWLCMKGFSRVWQHTWSISAKGYANRMQNGQVVFMHRQVLGFDLPEGWFVDHINGNKLDNRLSNLRAVNTQQNTMNRDGVEGTSKYKGVFFKSDKLREKPWTSHIKINQKTYHIGSFKTELEAAQAYDERAQFFFGEYARKNFPIGHPITIAHYLRVLGSLINHKIEDILMSNRKENELYVTLWGKTPEHGNKHLLKFNLTTQAPQSEEDYKKLAELFELV